MPLTGYKLYAQQADSDTITLVYDGTDSPEIVQTQISGLTLDADYSFYVTGLNPFEGPESDSATFRLAGRPDEPG